MRFTSLALAVGLALSAAAPLRAEVRHFEDATLHAVQFVDQHEGWAVGDEGVVWHTINAGKTWERQGTGTRASLRGLHFVNAFFGWVVGREELPHGGGSAGVVLFTNDGGVKWERLLPNAMPGLSGVCFVDNKTGYLFGDAGEQYPTGIFKTDDAGRTWKPVPGPRLTSWLGGAFRDGNGIFVGAWSRFGKLKGTDLATGNISELAAYLGGRNLRGVTWLDRRVLAVADGGLVLTSESSGDKWGFANLHLAPDVLQALDFHAVHGVGDRAWVVGRPGSVILHTADQGKTWKLQKTGQNLPLHGVFFRDELSGWAVGAAGTILATVDGGNTWKVQRRRGQRAALLGIHGIAAAVPVEAIAVTGVEEGYLTVGLRVLSPDPASAALRHSSDPQRWAAAMRLAGAMDGEALWQFPFPQYLVSGSLADALQYWNRLHNPRGDHSSGAGKLLLRQLVLALRLWRPDVILTDAAAAKTDIAHALLTEALKEAMSQAADPKAFPEQIDVLGLAPWRVARSYAGADRAGGAQVVIDGAEPRAQLEGAARDFATPAAALLSEQPALLPSQRFFRLADGKGTAGEQHSFFSGLRVADDARRKIENKELSDAVRKASRDRRNLEMIADKMDDVCKSFAPLAMSLSKLPDDTAAAATFAIASGYARRGQWLLAREAFLIVADRYPAHPLAADAYRWLIRHSASSEARRRQELGQFKLVTVARVGQDNGKDAKDFKGTQVVNRGQGTYLTDREEARQWYRGSLEFGKRLAGFGPLYAADPSIQFCLQAARRNLGEMDEANKWYGRFADHFARGPWHDAAAAELWINQGAGASSKPAAACRFTAKKPFLDGDLDDACWQETKPLVLTNAVADTSKEYPTEAWFAFDQEFFYIALRCRHPAGKQVAPVKPRPRDADLSAHDRVSILLDLDRDYATAYHLQIDQRGWVREDCWGDLSWNPRWFVAVKSTETAWQIEAAIPLTELTGDRITASTAWAANVARILPGRGVQAWSLPADVEPRPEGMGLLLFRAAK